MRIAYMLTSMGIGGAEKQVIDVAERLAARGHVIALLVLQSPEQHQWPTELPVFRLGTRKTFPSVVSGVFCARHILRSFKPDLVHSHTFPANMMARVLRPIGAAPAVLSTIHNIYEGGWTRTLLYRISNPLSSHTTAVSQAVADHYIRIKAVSPMKISVLTNGIDTEIFSPASVSPEAQSPHNGFIWLACGRDVPAKDFDTLLKAFQVVRAAAPGTQLRIAGKPSPRRATVTSAGVQWLGVSNDMARAFSECDGFVLSSAWEGMPLVVGEAMAMEKPVVANNVGGVCELLGNLGRLVPPNNPEQLANAMLRTMQIPATRRSEIGKAARSRIVEHFNLNDKVDEWERLYTHILCGPI